MLSQKTIQIGEKLEHLFRLILTDRAE